MPTHLAARRGLPVLFVLLAQVAGPGAPAMAAPIASAIPAVVHGVSPAEIQAILREVETRLGRLVRSLTTFSGNRVPAEIRTRIESLLARVKLQLSLAGNGLGQLEEGRDQVALLKRLGQAREAVRLLLEAERVFASLRERVQGSAITDRRAVDARRLMARAREALSRLPRARSQTRFKIALDTLEEADRLVTAGRFVDARSRVERAGELFRQVIAAGAAYETLSRRVDQEERRLERLRRQRASPTVLGPVEGSLRSVRSALESENFALAETLLRRVQREIAAARPSGSNRTSADETARTRESGDSTRTRARFSERSATPDADPGPVPENLVAADLDRTRRTLGNDRDLLPGRILDEAEKLLDRSRSLRAAGDEAGARAHARLADRLVDRARSMRRDETGRP